MFQLRDDHMQKFSEMGVRSFEDRAVKHLRTYLPGEVVRLSDDQLRDYVRRSMARCRAYGLITERQMLCFIDSGALIGENFDTDPAYPWAAFMLNSYQVPADKRASSVLEVALRVRQEQLRMLAMVAPEQRGSFFVRLDLDEYAKEASE